jgi:hypothetical protein
MENGIHLPEMRMYIDATDKFCDAELLSLSYVGGDGKAEFSAICQAIGRYDLIGSDNVQIEMTTPLKVIVKRHDGRTVDVDGVPHSIVAIKDIEAVYQADGTMHVAKNTAAIEFAAIAVVARLKSTIDAAFVSDPSIENLRDVEVLNDLARALQCDM